MARFVRAYQVRAGLAGGEQAGGRGRAAGNNGRPAAGAAGYLVAICLILGLMVAYVALLPRVAWPDGTTGMEVVMRG
jgi:hypothetical protein